MINSSDVLIVVCVSLLYLVLLPIQLVIFPMQYYSIKDLIYSRNWKKSTGALVSRFIFILIMCFISWIIDKKSQCVIWGVSIGSFLCAWPSIYHYQLFAFFKNKYKFLYFCGCLVSVLFSWACATFIMKMLMPMIFENKGFYLVDNSGINTLVTILGLGGPVGIRRIMKKDQQDNPYLVGDTFQADLYLTKRKIVFQKSFIEQYSNEILQSAEKYNIDSDLLKTIIQLEIINRNSLYNRILEKISVRFFPGVLIHIDASLGLAQIKISTAKDYFHMAPRRYLSDMLKPEINIDLCAFTLKKILEEYDNYDYTMDENLEGLDEDQDITDDFVMSVYIASRYICGKNYILNKYVLVYAKIISETCPATMSQRL